MITLFANNQTDYLDQLAVKFELQLAKNLTPDEWQLQLTETGLQLNPPAELKQNPYQIDFLSTAFLRRIKQFGSKQPLAKAIGLKTQQPPTVIDMTAGFGRDAVLLASLGCKVTMIERSPILAALLYDALQRFQHSSFNTIAERLQLVFADSKDYLEKSKATADVIYLDPMFPARKKTALVKKEMQILHAIIAHDNDKQSLLQSALLFARQRVVVKRPRLGEYLGDKQPSLEFTTKTHRFDIYLVNH